MTERPWLTVTSYAHAYGVHRNTVHKWLASGLLVTYRVGRLVRIRHEPPHVQKALNYVNRKQGQCQPTVAHSNPLCEAPPC